MTSLTTKGQTNKQSSLPENWKKAESAYTGDDLIDAFLQGKEAGRNETFRILLAQLNGNIEKATSLAEKLYTEAVERKFKATSIHLKAEDLTKFKALFVVEKDDFLSEGFRDLYIIARYIKNESESENFYLSFSFLPNSDKLSEECLNADGYFMKYEKK